MMDFQLTLPHILKRAETFFGDGEIVTRLPDKSFHRTNHRETLRRARQLAVALQKLGLERGDRVATLCWNHHQHHEAYFGIPCGGFVLHTLNLRLHPNDLAYIADHGGDRAVIVDRSLVPLLDQFRERTAIEQVFVVEDSYEELLATASPDEWRDPELDENEAAAMCYTSGTTGLPKGVCYSHRSTVLHSVGVAANNPLGIGIAVNDAILPVVPMFHANAWGYPYVATMTGSKLVYPGPHLDPESLLDLMADENVAWAAGVPTIWMGILQLLDANPGRWDLSSMKAMLVGGSAVPRRRHRVDPSARLHPDQGPVEGCDQVGRRVDLVGRARERTHGSPGRGGGSGHRDPGREVGGAPARGRRPEGGRVGERRRAARVPRSELREVLAARPNRVHRRDPEDERR